MNNTDQATARPWKYAHDDEKHRDIMGFVKGMILDEEGFTLANITTKPERLKLIVKAVNSHDYLLYALREYVAEWEQTHAHEDSKTGITQEPCSLMLAKHALAKAEGKGEG